MQRRRLQDDLPGGWMGVAWKWGVDAFVWHMHFERLVYGI